MTEQKHGCLMKSILVLVTLTPFLTFVESSATAGPADADPERIPWEPKGDGVNIGYWGAVTEVTKNSITIQLPNKKVKPRTFVTSEILAAGLIPKEPRMRATPRGPVGYHVSPTSMYRLTDVKVGDLVTIHYARLGVVDICDHVSIQKRPGGHVPPLADEVEELMRPGPSPAWAKRPLRARYIPYNEYMNAYWDLEDKGIPFPEKFGDQRRWPVAPAPREVRLSH